MELIMELVMEQARNHETENATRRARWNEGRDHEPDNVGSRLAMGWERKGMKKRVDQSKDPLIGTITSAFLSIAQPHHWLFAFL